MKKASINLYEFKELGIEAKRTAIEAHREFLLATMSPDDFISGCPEYDTPEELKKQYNSEYNFYLNNDYPIIENIEANEYLFYKSGELAHCVTYTDTGKTFFIDGGNKYEVTPA